MKHLVVGTAGHVDHGKTMLVKALTGVDTDRLKEEKERGITIELGFASLALPDGRILGVVDVPGHERFIKNMVAGAGGIDLVIMVIAADEGVMPQTREHLHICSLLGIKKGLVALTKADLVDAPWIELVTDDVRQFLAGTFLEHSPVIPLSAATGAGIPQLYEALAEMVSRIEESEDNGVFRLPVDRVFTMKGFGTVVTGTLLSGRLTLGEEMEIMPRRIKAKVRGLQVHNRAVEAAEAGQRTAVNMQGIEKTMIMRGDVLAHPSALEPSTRMDVLLEHLTGTGKRIKNRTLLRLHIGTSEILARTILMDREELAPGERGYAQFLLEKQAVVMAGDRFVVRSYSPVTTIGGGMILDPHGVKYRGAVDELLKDFQCLDEGPDMGRTALIVRRAGLTGITETQLTERTGLRNERLKGILKKLFSGREALPMEGEGGRVLSFHAYTGIRDGIIRETGKYHNRFPLKEGIHKEELRTTLGRFVDARIVAMAVRDLEKEGKLVVDRELVRLKEHRVNLQGELEDLRAAIARIYLEAGLAPPLTKELMARFVNRKTQADNVIAVMLKEGSLVKISEDLYFHREAMQKLREDYRAMLIREGRAAPANFKDLTGLSRKFVIPLMEYFDMTKLTIRAGEFRILRDKTANS